MRTSLVFTEQLVRRHGAHFFVLRRSFFVRDQVRGEVSDPSFSLVAKDISFGGALNERATVLRPHR